MNIGDRIRDNDPRIKAISDRVLTIIDLSDDRVQATDVVGRKFKILRRRIYTDGKARRNGFDLVTG